MKLCTTAGVTNKCLAFSKNISNNIICICIICSNAVKSRCLILKTNIQEIPTASRTFTTGDAALCRTSQLPVVFSLTSRWWSSGHLVVRETRRVAPPTWGFEVFLMSVAVLVVSTLSVNSVPWDVDTHIWINCVTKCLVSFINRRMEATNTHC